MSHVLSVTDIICLNKCRNDGVWVGHLLSGYSLPMEDPSHQKKDSSDNGIGGTWKQAIKVSFEVTRAAFPGGEIIAHLDHKYVCFLITLIMEFQEVDGNLSV